MQHTLASLRVQHLGLVPQQMPSSVGRRLVCAPVCAKKGKQAPAKVNKRGKVSSRPGPGWQPAAEAMPPATVQQQQQPDQQQQQPSPAAAVSADTPVQSQTQPQQLPQQPQPAAPSPPRQQGGGQVLAETPQVVVDRMFKRVITFAGLPVLTGMMLFPVFWYLRVVAKVEYPIWVVYVTQALMFGGGLLGISYGILSTSWDPRREGTALGWTELQANLPVLLNKNKDQQ